MLETVGKWDYFIISKCFDTKWWKLADVYNSNGALENQRGKVEWTLKYLKKNFVYIFILSLSVCKICTLQSKKNRRKKFKLCTYSCFITPAPLYTRARFWTDPIPSNWKRTLWMAPYHNKIDQSNGNNNFLWKKKTCTLQLLASVLTDADILTKLVSIYKEEILLYSILAIQQINFECKETLK